MDLLGLGAFAGFFVEGFGFPFPLGRTTSKQPFVKKIVPDNQVNHPLHSVTATGVYVSLSVGKMYEQR